MVQPVKISKKKDRTRVVVSGSMTIAQAAQLRDGLLQAFDFGKKVELSLAGVTELDLTALQILCSSHRTSYRKGVELTVVGADLEPVLSVAGLAGMLRHTGCVQDVNCSCIWKR